MWHQSSLSTVEWGVGVEPSDEDDDSSSHQSREVDYSSRLQSVIRTVPARPSRALPNLVLVIEVGPGH